LLPHSGHVVVVKFAWLYPQKMHTPLRRTRFLARHAHASNISDSSGSHHSGTNAVKRYDDTFAAKFTGLYALPPTRGIHAMRHGRCAATVCVITFNAGVTVTMSCCEG